MNSIGNLKIHSEKIHAEENYKEEQNLRLHNEQHSIFTLESVGGGWFYIKTKDHGGNTMYVKCLRPKKGKKFKVVLTNSRGILLLINHLRSNYTCE